MFTTRPFAFLMRHGPLGLAQRSAALLDRRLRARPVTGRARTREGVRFPIDTTDVIQRYLAMFGTWEPNLSAWITSRLAPGDTMIDVGAHHGYYAALAAHRVGPAGHVVAIEPIPDYCLRLREVLEDNSIANVRAVPRAVAAAAGTVRLWLGAETNLGNTTSFQDGHAQSLDVAAAALPDLLLDGEWESARIVKVDVEGAEADVVAGLAGHLDRLRPDCELVVEVTPRTLRKTGRSVNEILGPLTAAGFYTYRIPNDYEPASYPADMRSPRLPVRWEGEVTDMSDLVFSRADTDVLRSERPPAHQTGGRLNRK